MSRLFSARCKTYLYIGLHRALKSCSHELSKTFSLKYLEDVSSFCNFEPENKKSMRPLCVLSKISEMATDWLQ